MGSRARIRLLRFDRKDDSEWNMKPITRVRMKKVTKWVIIIALILTVIFAAFTIYGSQVGNFVVNIEQEKNVNLSLFDNVDMADGTGTSNLSFQGMTDQTPCTYPAHIPDDIEDGIGSKNDTVNRRYIAFSFIVRNNSEFAVDIQAELNIVAVTKNVDAAMRVMVIVDGVKTIYAKPKDYPESEIGQPEDKPYYTVAFLSPTTVCRQEFLNVPSGRPLKITIVVWLEGEDRECTDDIKGGSVKMEMLLAGR